MILEMERNGLISDSANVSVNQLSRLISADLFRRNGRV